MIKQKTRTWNNKHHFYRAIITAEHLAKPKVLYFTFVDLEEAFD